MYTYTKIALCVVETGKGKESLKNECNCRKRVCVSIHSWRKCKVVSSSNLQKEDKVDESFFKFEK